jgi:hypothetical protein
MATIFRREWVVPFVALVLVSAPAEASRDELSAQAAGDLHCGSVSIVRSAPNEYLATGCGQDRTYTCDDSDVCTSSSGAVVTTMSDDEGDGDNAAAEAVAEAITDMACACASAGLASHGSHHSSGTHHSKSGR